MQDDFQHATPEGSSGKGIYQDNGSGGWKQTENVIDGAWNRFYNIDNPEGPYGIGRECPGEVASEPFDNCTNTTSGADRSKVLACSCQLIFTHNFVRTYNNRGSGSDEQPHIGGNCLTFANWWGNASKDNYTELPAAAKQIIAEAGPRPKTPKTKQ